MSPALPVRPRVCCSSYSGGFKSRLKSSRPTWSVMGLNVQLVGRAVAQQSAHLVCMSSGVPSPTPHKSGRVYILIAPSPQPLEGRKIRSSTASSDPRGQQPELIIPNKQAHRLGMEVRALASSTACKACRSDVLFRPLQGPGTHTGTERDVGKTFIQLKIYRHFQNK